MADAKEESAVIGKSKGVFMKRSVPAAPLRGRATSNWTWGWLAAGGLLSFFALGCAGSLEPGVGTGGMAGSGGGTDCQTAIFASKCVGCHATASASAGLDLQSANPEMRLVGKPTGAGTSCPGGTLLVANVTPASWVFIDKLTMNPPSCGGSQMPLGGSLLPAELSCLTTWANGVVATAPFIGEETP
jgi:hypothetical protein